MPNGFFGADLDTIGMELEGISLDQESVALMLSFLQKSYPHISRQINMTHDASTEFNASFVRTGLGTILVSNHTPEFENLLSDKVIGSKRMGYELVTNPLGIPELEALIYPTIAFLEKSGDFLSDRAAIHYHVGFPHNLRMMKNFLRIALMIDPVLFRLGGMGRTFRGKTNHAAYARPLLNSTAVNVLSNSRSKQYARIINPMHALEANSLEEFWASFGVRYRLGGASAKYHPCRYVGINFYSIPQHNTVEFRHFNQSHNSYLLLAIGKMVRGFAELATVLTKADYPLFEVVPSNKEISMGDSAEILGKLISLCRNKELENLPSEEEMAEIMTVLSKSHFEEIPETPVLTHLRDDNNTITMEMVTDGNLQIVKEVLPPHFCDIHNIRYRSIYDDVNIGEEPPKNPPTSMWDAPEEMDSDNEEEFDDEESDDEESEE